MIKHIAFIVFLLTSNSLALADEVRVLDQHGLVRGMRSVAAKARVEVAVKGGSGPELSLRDTEGNNESLRSAQKKGETFIFFNVPPGSWQVESEAVVAKVVIAPE